MELIITLFSKNRLISFANDFISVRKYYAILFCDIYNLVDGVEQNYNSVGLITEKKLHKN